MHTLETLANGQQRFTSEAKFPFVLGGCLPQLSLVFETYGQLNAQKDNVVLVHHALSTHSHIASHALDPSPGWWQDMVGAGCPIDTDQYYVICCNNLGSCFGSSGPTSTNPNTGQPYRLDFPALSIADMVNAQMALLDALGIEQVHAVIGPSMGAMLSLTMALNYPLRLKKFIAISSSYKTYPANDAVHAIQRDIIRLDPNWQQGHYTNTSLVGFDLARKFGHLSYRNKSELNHRFDQSDDERTIHDYLDYNARKFTQKFDANSYIYLTEAMDRFNVTKGVKDAHTAFAPIQAESLIIAVSSDHLFPPYQQQALYDYLQQAGKSSRFKLVQSDYGHDAFLVETEKIGRLIAGFL